YFEGFGVVMLEAMAAGLVVIATDATGAPDVMKDGVEGYIIPAGDAHALRDAMQRILDSPKNLETMSVSARQCAERNSWNTFGDRWMAILKEVDETHASASVSTNVPNLGTSRESPRINALLVHPGTQYSFRLAEQLHVRGCLGRFWTGVAYLQESAIGH